MTAFFKLCLMFLLVYATLSAKTDPSSNTTVSTSIHPDRPSPRPRPSADTIRRYRKFINQHVDQNMVAKRCNDEINCRKISVSDDNKECKEANTFILATTNHINVVCNKAGTPYKGRANLRKSNQPFWVVNCKADVQGRRLPRCSYKGGTARVYVVLDCAEGYPVHYETGVPAN
ncbi:ribonuclease-like 3 [Engraulis encrasicolus]|uniref:ribonuclease-like 3 n=1 Tax=Engraulis encrasicolus TaxID=184585 RepID=UPI002FD5A091